MLKIEDCLINVKTALKIRHLVSEAEFLCPSCKEPVKPHSDGIAVAAHFEHHERNLDCPLSDKTNAKILYEAYLAEKAAWRESGGEGGFLEVFLARHNIRPQA